MTARKMHDEVRHQHKTTTRHVTTMREDDIWWRRTMTYGDIRQHMMKRRNVNSNDMQSTVISLTCQSQSIASKCPAPKCHVLYCMLSFRLTSVKVNAPLVIRRRQALYAANIGPEEWLHTMGDFTFWLRLSLRLSLSLNFGLSTYLSQKVKWFRWDFRWA